MTGERFRLDSSGTRAHNENRSPPTGAAWGDTHLPPRGPALDETDGVAQSAALDSPTAPTAALSAGRRCACGPGEVAAPHCLCSRDPTFLGVLGTVETGEQRRQRFLRTLDTAGRILRVVDDGNATHAHVVPLHTSDIGSVLYRWTLNLAVPCRASRADACWQGYPVRWIRTVAQAPWLRLAGCPGGVRLTDDRIELEVADAFLATRGGPMEILVGPVDGGRPGARGADKTAKGVDQ
jgi:hypothetical protein